MRRFQIRLGMGSAIEDRRSGASECAGAQLDLKRAGADTWVVEAPGSGAADPPLRVLFGGPNAPERALEFYLQCGRTSQAGASCGPTRDAPAGGVPKLLG